MKMRNEMFLFPTEQDALGFIKDVGIEEWAMSEPLEDGVILVVPVFDQDDTPENSGSHAKSPRFEAYKGKFVRLKRHSR